MKWTVALAGALLSLAGFYWLYNGMGIIQVERGWATFIAGSVLLGAGVVVLGIAALMGRVDRLADLYEESLAQDGDESEPAAAQSWAPQDAQSSPREPVPEPPPSATPVVPLPAFSTPAPPPADIAPQAPARAPGQQQPPEAEQPSSLRDFEFVFPPPEPHAEEAAPPAPAPSAHLTSRPAWFRRGKPEGVEPGPAPAPAPDFTSAPPREKASLAGENFDDQTESTAPDQDAARPEFAQAPSPTPADSEPAPDEAPARPEPDPFSSDWLEQALAEANEASRRVSSLSPPPTPRPGLVGEPPEQAVFKGPRSPNSQGAERAGEDDGAPESASGPAGSGSQPVEIGRYRANDVAYIMFSDGSITAETPAGNNYRFGSLVELRAFIERGGV